jgi:serine/threonine protein kinase
MMNTPEELGWVEPDITFEGGKVTLVRSLGSGRTSVVFEGNLNGQSVVVKMAKNDLYLPAFQREREVLHELAALNSPNLPKLILEAPNMLVMSPLGKRVNSLSKEDVHAIITLLKRVHDALYNFIHRDIRKYNILRDVESDQVILLDWGYSVAKGRAAPFAGALECMPDDVLMDIYHGKEIDCGPRIDLVSFVRLFYLLIHRPEIERLTFGNNPDVQSYAQKVHVFWSSRAKSDIWAHLHSLAENVEYDDLIEEIQKLF